MHCIHLVGRFLVHQKKLFLLLHSSSPLKIKCFPPFPSSLFFSSADQIFSSFPFSVLHWSNSPIRVLHCLLRIILCHSSHPGPKSISRPRSLTNCPTPSPSALYCSTTSFSTASSTVIIQPIIRLLLSSGCGTEENKWGRGCVSHYQSPTKPRLKDRGSSKKIINSDSVTLALFYLITHSITHSPMRRGWLIQHSSAQF